MEGCEEMMQMMHGSEKMMEMMHGNNMVNMGGYQNTGFISYLSIYNILLLVLFAALIVLVFLLINKLSKTQ